MTVHLVVVTLAVLAVTFAARFPSPSEATAATTPQFVFSGVAGSAQSRVDTYFRAGPSLQTRDSITALVARPDVASVRSAGAISPVSSFSSGVSIATAASGEAGAGIKPLADIVDPQKPYAVYEASAGDTVGGIAKQFGISVRTFLENNPTVPENYTIKVGQQFIVPRKDGILYKVGHGDTVDSIVAQYDNITAGTVIEFRPNAIRDPKALQQGEYLLLPGATVKPPPPPPPPPKVTTPSGGGTITGGGSGPRPGGSGKFVFPLARWHGISDQFGSPRGGGTYHTGIDLDLFGMHHSNVFSSCAGVVTKVEYLTYSYGYHVIVDCGEGWTTLYAHFDQINVSPGQRVGQGTLLGISGLTGFTTGEHLHFEIRFQGAYVNPADYLPF